MYILDHVEYSTVPTAYVYVFPPWVICTRNRKFEVIGHMALTCLLMHVNLYSTQKHNDTELTVYIGLLYYQI